MTGCLSRLAGSACLLLAGLCLTACGAGASPVRVMSWNIHHGEGGDGRIDLRRIATVINAADPDLIALQEVDVGTRRSGGVDQAAELARLTGMHAAFGRAIDYQGGRYGQAILSRRPIAEPQVHALPTSHEGEQRIALSATVRLGERGPAIRFISTHLDHRPDPADRLAQARRLNELFAQEDDPPTVLAGDLNDGPDDRTLTVLLGSWRDAAAESPRPTYRAEAPRPRKRIDYVLYRPADRFRVVETAVVDEPVASDHRPVLATLRLAPGSAAEPAARSVWDDPIYRFSRESHLQMRRGVP